jgi:hypothetical protein
MAFQLASIAVLCAMAVYLVVSYASIGRPIWLDEFVQFGLGSHLSTEDVWNTFRQKYGDHFTGQTGAYMIIDYWLLKLFGASAFWLRIPSVASALFMAYATIVFFHVRGFEPFWSLLAILALFCQSNLMHYAGEARPYMPLAAASVGVLAYYSIPYSMRGKWWAFSLGLVAILLGALMHAYFPVYWLALACFTFWDVQGYSIREFNLASFIRHCNPLLSAIGAILYFSIGTATWMRGGPDLHLDPFF